MRIKLTDGWVVQKARKEHMRQIAQIYVSSWKTTYSGLLLQSYLDSLDADEQQQKWEEYMRQQYQGIFIAVDGEQVLGFAAFRPF